MDILYLFLINRTVRVLVFSATFCFCSSPIYGKSPLNRTYANKVETDQMALKEPSDLVLFCLLIKENPKVSRHIKVLDKTSLFQ